MQRFLLSLLALATACSATDPGSGTQTLFANVEVTGRPDGTTVEVELKFRGNAVPDANVVVTNVDSDATTTLEGKSGGVYKATLPSYAQALRIKVTSGDDQLEGALEGPAPHVITRPPNDAIVRRADFETLLVEWEADGAAERVEIEPEGVDAISVEGDQFEAEIPLGPLKSRAQHIGVTRETSVELSGGTEGSRMRARYKVDNRFTLEG